TNEPEIAERAMGLVGEEEFSAKAKAVMTVMQCATESKTGLEWQKVLQGETPAYENTLFLLDRDFQSEGIPPEQADELLRETVAVFIGKESSNYCVVLTKEVSIDDEMPSRKALLQELLGGMPDEEALIRFSVISKNALQAKTEDTLSQRLRD